MQAKTKEENKRCFDWLWSKKCFPLTDKFFYEEKDGAIVAVAGVIHCSGIESFFVQIEPMISENARASDKLYNEIIEYAKSIKSPFAFAGSANPITLRHLEKRGWKKFNLPVTQYIKELKQEN